MPDASIIAMDVDYRPDGARAAAVAFADWPDAVPSATRVETIADVADYEPGAFYRRELPCLLAVIEALAVPPGVLVVDGYVWLGPDGEPGLGAHLHEAVVRSVPVVGVAKTAFRGAAWAEAVLRGSSDRPLFVTAVGMDQADAARAVAAMHGPHRIPTLLRQVDRLARDAD